MATAAILAGVDWPIRNSSKGDQPTCSDQVSELQLVISAAVVMSCLLDAGRLLSTVKRIPSMSQTYDQALAKARHLQIVVMDFGLLLKWR